MIDDIKRVHIEASSRCNSKCPMCSRFTNTGFVQPNLVQKDLTPEVFLKFFTPERCENLEEVYFSGVYGEPCLNREIISFVQHLNQFEMTVTIDSNAGVQRPDWWADLAQQKVRVNFSIDGLEDTNHIYRRNVKWDALWQNVAAYTRAGGKGTWTFIVFRHNEHQVIEAKRRAEEIGLKFRAKATQKFNGHKNWSVMDKGYKLYDLLPPQTALYRHSNVGEKEHDPKEDYFNFTKKFSRENIMDPIEIDCLVKKRREVFLASTGHLYPCCYLGTPHKDSPGAYQFSTNFSLDRFNLEKESVESVLNTFKEIEKGWQKDSLRAGKLYTCAQVCGKTKDSLVKYV